MERWTPWVLAVIGVLASLVLHHMGWLASVMISTALVDAMVTFASIIVGFVGVLLGILMSIKNDAAVVELFKTPGKDTLRTYFREAILSGIFLVAFSAVVGLRTLLDDVLPSLGSYSPSVMLFAVWVGLSVFVFAATYRIAGIMMHIIFHSDDNENATSKPMLMDEKQEEELKALFRKPGVGEGSGTG